MNSTKTRIRSNCQTHDGLYATTADPTNFPFYFPPFNRQSSSALSVEPVLIIKCVLSLSRRGVGPHCPRLRRRSAGCRGVCCPYAFALARLGHLRLRQYSKSPDPAFLAKSTQPSPIQRWQVSPLYQQSEDESWVRAALLFIACHHNNSFCSHLVLCTFSRTSDVMAANVDFHRHRFTTAILIILCFLSFAMNIDLLQL